MIVTRFHDVEKLEFTVEFLSPTFLGGADQNAELRSPPFKNLLRQWWRVMQGNLDPDLLCQREGKLFGTVLGEDSAVASKVRLSLVPGDGFKLQEDLPSVGKIEHPQVKKAKDGVEILLYLGYGPVNAKRVFIAPGSKATIVLRCPKQNKNEVLHTLSLAHHFGTVGSRSRNGYGSVVFSGVDLLSLKKLAENSKNLDDILRNNSKKYPSALAKDTKSLLCWDTKPDGSWQTIFKSLAQIYLEARLSLDLKRQNEIEPRHIMGYPVGGNHKVQNWGGEKGRMPSQLRLMVKRDDQGQMIGRILHLPHPVPKPWDPKVGQEAELWKKVHACLDRQLDRQKELQRCGGGR